MSEDTSGCFGPAVRWVDYDLPCPSILAFDYEIDAGVVRTAYDSGHHRQRRRYKHRPTYYEITWSGLTTVQLKAWEEFAQSFGTDWFYTPLVTAQVGRWHVMDHLVRMVGNPQVSLQEKNRWFVAVRVEQQKIDMDCMFEMQCDDIVACLEKASFPPIDLDWTNFNANWKDSSYWGAPNG
jgi:hypothetical protein